MSVLFSLPWFKVWNVCLFSSSLRHWILNEKLLRCKECPSIGLEEFIYRHLNSFLISAQSSYILINAFYSNRDPFSAAEFFFHCIKDLLEIVNYFSQVTIAKII